MKILQGNFDQSDHIKFPEFFGRQCSANAVAAACRTSTLKPELWVPSTIDQCLYAGNDLFPKSFRMSRPQIQANQLYLRVDELIPSVKFSNEVK